LINDVFEGEDSSIRCSITRASSWRQQAEQAVGLIKRAIQTGLQGSQWEGLAFERELLAQAFASADAAEGLSAYKDKRVAKFEGSRSQKPEARMREFWLLASGYWLLDEEFYHGQDHNF